MLALMTRIFSGITIVITFPTLGMDHDILDGGLGNCKGKNCAKLHEVTQKKHETNRKTVPVQPDVDKNFCSEKLPDSHPF